ncbi:MAG: hypothetical protein II549_03885, partial [Bacteroidaceae bacterium]|nr:hypothetical protein [Bacteroidaceae bacterium]
MGIEVLFDFDGDAADHEDDFVGMLGNVLIHPKFRYIMLHKPAGVLTAARDKSQKTVLDLLPPDDRR